MTNCRLVVVDKYWRLRLAFFIFSCGEQMRRQSSDNHLISVISTPLVLDVSPNRSCFRGLCFISIKTSTTYIICVIASREVCSARAYANRLAVWVWWRTSFSVRPIWPKIDCGLCIVAEYTLSIMVKKRPRRNHYVFCAAMNNFSKSAKALTASTSECLQYLRLNEISDM